MVFPCRTIRDSGRSSLKKRLRIQNEALASSSGAAIMTVEDHVVTLFSTSRYGSWAICACKWKSRACETVFAAQVKWAHHIESKLIAKEGESK